MLLFFEVLRIVAHLPSPRPTRTPITASLAMKSVFDHFSFLPPTCSPSWLPVGTHFTRVVPGLPPLYFLNTFFFLFLSFLFCIHDLKYDYFRSWCFRSHICCSSGTVQLPQIHFSTNADIYSRSNSFSKVPRLGFPSCVHLAPNIFFSI